MQELDEARLKREAAFRNDTTMLTTKWQGIQQNFG
jgi:hypothetical protein